MNVSSPCIDICKLDETGEFCTGCFRTRSEIANWLRFSEKERFSIMTALEKRKPNSMLFYTGEKSK